MSRVPVCRQGPKIGNHHQVMTSFCSGMSSQCFCKLLESEDRAALGSAPNPTLHGFCHLCAYSGEIEEKCFKKARIVARPNGIEPTVCLEPLPCLGHKLVVMFQRS